MELAAGRTADWLPPGASGAECAAEAARLCGLMLAAAGRLFAACANQAPIGAELPLPIACAEFVTAAGVVRRLIDLLRERWLLCDLERLVPLRRAAEWAAAERSRAKGAPPPPAEAPRCVAGLLAARDCLPPSVAAQRLPRAAPGAPPDHPNQWVEDLGAADEALASAAEQLSRAAAGEAGAEQRLGAVVAELQRVLLAACAELPSAALSIRADLLAACDRESEAAGLRAAALGPGAEWSALQRHCTPGPA
eukprot:TRINITY_DN16660_c0_g1_i1.p1 TRINITY_DN16660_c0_g1~~TRINITY_DN16660_c0_g1_i1.p1  ORF type:complete len:274 (+),score=101.14 TRINITY_DN16660_c0_g1_i1:71-823(+)